MDRQTKRRASKKTPTKLIYSTFVHFADLLETKQVINEHITESCIHRFSSILRESIGVTNELRESGAKPNV